jgi:dTDP-glucose 4,6-dehydratase
MHVDNSLHDPEPFIRSNIIGTYTLLEAIRDTTKIRTELGWLPRYGDFRAGLAATIDWYHGNEWWWKPQKEATEARYQVLGR